MELFDKNKRKINELEFIGKKENRIEITNLGDKARFIRLNFQENFTGKYFIIKILEFYAFDEIN